MSASTRHFVRHYLEMLLAMFAGMFVLGMPVSAALRLLGMTSAQLEAPAMMLALMAVTMTVPMLGWMRFRGHRWAPCSEMAASMVLPTLAVLGLFWAGVVQGIGPLMVLEHAAMLPSMLVAMLLRRDEYTGGTHGRATAAIA